MQGAYRSIVSRLAALVCGALLVSASPVFAAEITLQNDSLASATAGTALPTFLPNEQAASWLTTPISGNLVGVQVIWDSLLGGNPASQEFAIHVYGAGAFPVPGPLLASVVAPVMNDGSLNEYRFLDPPGNSAALKVPVTAGQTYVVAIEFLNQSSGMPLASSVVYDADGCQLGLNTVFSIPGGWADACPLGVPGDFGIRAIIVPEPATAVLLLMGLVVAGRRFLVRG